MIDDETFMALDDMYRVMYLARMVKDRVMSPAEAVRWYHRVTRRE